ncbi:MAG: hypothetical protein KGM16_02505 [Bacteroidota bacterium]|nr:hypothetical protein [Bacteroidota bacterium]
MKKCKVVYIFAILISGLAVKSQNSSQFFTEKNLITTGIYPEHWNIPGTAKIFVGEKVLKAAGVLV